MNVGYTGPLKQLKLMLENDVSSTGAQRLERAALRNDATRRAEEAPLGSYVCVETHSSEQTLPWVVGKVVQTALPAQQATGRNHMIADALRLHPIQVGEKALAIQVLEALEPGSTTYFQSELVGPNALQP